MLSKIGSTEIFTENAEPPLDEKKLKQTTDDFLEMLPDGERDPKSKTFVGKERASNTDLHLPLH
ncbi:MAG: hypothetical protein MK538_00025 [Planctomycetes bacterium]|nr:hypothetical protein [Planctomycetota bacterium]